MTNKELIELAAKAAGIEGWWADNQYYYGNKDNTNILVRWNPLENDADALRLAVRLPTINVSHIIMASHQQREMALCAYVCRGITEAAAEIGKSMP